MSLFGCAKLFNRLGVSLKRYEDCNSFKALSDCVVGSTVWSVVCVPPPPKILLRMSPIAAHFTVLTVYYGEYYNFGYLCDKLAEDR
jgi:hypothetical protein